MIIGSFTHCLGSHLEAVDGAICSPPALQPLALHVRVLHLAWVGALGTGQLLLPSAALPVPDGKAPMLIIFPVNSSWQGDLWKFFTVTTKNPNISEIQLWTVVRTSAEDSGSTDAFHDSSGPSCWQPANSFNEKSRVDLYSRRSEVVLRGMRGSLCIITSLHSGRCSRILDSPLEPTTLECRNSLICVYTPNAWPAQHKTPADDQWMFWWINGSTQEGLYSVVQSK